MEERRVQVRNPAFERCLEQTRKMGQSVFVENSVKYKGVLDQSGSPRVIMVMMTNQTREQAESYFFRHYRRGELVESIQ